MDEIIIRRAELEDLVTIQELNHKLFLSDSQHEPTLNTNWPYEDDGTSYFRKVITSNDSACFVAEANHEIIGYLAGEVRKPFSAWTVHRSEIENMYVVETHRSKGIGSQLIDAFFSWSKEQGVTRVLVGAFAHNERAIAFYQKKGFRPYECLQEAVLDEHYL